MKALGNQLFPKGKQAKMTYLKHLNFDINTAMSYLCAKLIKNEF